MQVLRHPRSKGPAAARNTGLAACDTDFVAFLDSDVVPRRGWLEALLGHFCDPAVALVAPRIVGLAQPDNLVARYEAVRSSLDLGQREAPVVPYGTVSYVPSAAIICRRSVLTRSAASTRHCKSGEDVDLCWRLIEAGARLRYEPIALVGHEHRTQLRDWFARKAFYGESAAPLSVRHPGKTAPLVISGWTLVVWVLLAMGSAIGYLASMVRRRGHRSADRQFAAARSRPSPRKSRWSPCTGCGRPRCNSPRRSAGTTGRSRWSPHCCLDAAGQVVLVAAILDGVVDWLRRQRQCRRRHQADRVGHLPAAQAPRRHRLRCRAVDRRGPRTARRRAQTADPDLKRHIAQFRCSSRAQ